MEHFNKTLIRLSVDTEKWLVTILPGISLFLVLYVYKGYNIDTMVSTSGHSLLQRALIYAFSTSFIFYLLEFCLKPEWQEFSIKRWVLWTIIELLAGIHLNFILYNYFWLWEELYWISYFKFFYEFPLVMFFPLLVGRMASITPKPLSGGKFVTFASNNGKDQLQLSLDDLLFIQSANNYVEIVYEINKRSQTHLLRKNLKDIENELNTFPSMVRCHRSYLINMQQIRQIKKKNNHICLFIGDQEIPVSKSKMDLFINASPNF